MPLVPRKRIVDERTWVWEGFGVYIWLGWQMRVMAGGCITANMPGLKRSCSM